MKVLLCIHMVSLFVYGCSLLTKESETEKFIPGTYIRFSNHEYGSEYDTLVISIQNNAAAEYKVIRKWKYERVLDGQSIEPEYKQQVTVAYYDPKFRVLREENSGTIYSFDIAQNILFIGPIKYEKL